MSQAKRLVKKTGWPLAILLGLASTVLLAWPWGSSGLGLALAAWAAAGIGFLARHAMQAAKDTADVTQPDLSAASDSNPDPQGSTQPPESLYPTTQPDFRLASQKWLRVTKDLADTAQSAATLTEAMSSVGQMLHQSLGSMAWHCLRVDGWNGETALLRPWWDFEGKDDDHIDPAAMATVRATDLPLGHALLHKQPYLADLKALLGPKGEAPWRTGPATKVLAVPVFVDRMPLALLEFVDPGPLTSDQHLLLQVAAIQLGFVAQRDDTQSRMADNAEHLGRLGLVASRISSGVALLDRHGTVEWINPMFTALTGWSGPSVLGHKLTALLRDSVQNPDLAEQVEQLLEAGGPFRVSYEASRTGHGKVVRYWGEIDAILMLDDTGAHGQYVCLFNDITTRKQQEHLQSQEKEFLEALLGNLPVSLLVMDPTDFTVAALNRFAEQELDLKHDDVIKRPIGQVLGKEVIQVIQPRMQEAINSGKTVEHDFEWETTSRRFVVNARHFALRHANGEPRLLITLARDITQARQARVDLEESERRFRELVESMDDSVYVATKGHQRLVYFSPGLPETCGLSLGTVEDHNEAFQSLVVEEDRAALVEANAHCDLLDTTDVVMRIQHPQKGLRWVRRRTRARQLDNGDIRIYGLVSDVTEEREQAFELQRARDAAENASQAKSQFMASMSHEIRTPMNAILGMTELMLGTRLTDTQRRYAQSVFRSGESLLEIINDILDFSKIEAGRQELAPSDFPLQTMIDDTLELMAPRAHEKGIEIASHVQPGLPAMIHADSLRLQQILTNLVANAIKFTESGEVVVDLRRVDEDLTLSVADMVGQTIEIEFSVRDTGIGIPSEAIPRLFNAFTQANAGLSRRYGGTGLGLAISKQLVELMGGKIEAHSAPGVGSEFIFRVPVIVAEGTSHFGMLDETDMPPLHVLVVDDNATNLTVLDNLLSAWGMQVTCATDGQEALELLMKPEQDLDIDLALVDMKMPRMNGIELARAVKQSSRYQSLKMVMLSSICTPDDQQQAHKAGYSRFLSKPLRKTELRQVILGLSVDLAVPSSEMPSLQLKVLVVEDNHINQEVCSQMLAKMGCRSTVASSAMEGLRRLTEDRFDVVLMDIQMPGMDGMEALAAFRNNKNNRFQFRTPVSTPVVAVTANALEGDDKKFLASGFDAYLSKPFRMHQLLRVLQSVTSTLDTEPVPSLPKSVSLAPEVSFPVTARTTLSGETAAEKNAEQHAEKQTEEQAQTRPVATGTEALNATAAELTKQNSPSALSDSDTVAHWRDVFDETAVQRLIELDPSGRNALIERVTKMYASSVDKYLSQLDDACRANDLKVIKDVAHTLKSSSANLGALKLSQVCAEIEAVIRDETPTDLTPMIQTLRHEAAKALAALPMLSGAAR
jgi:two-component system sensor histidine kinase/response regulator